MQPACLHVVIVQGIGIQRGLVGLLLQASIGLGVVVPSFKCDAPGSL